MNLKVVHIYLLFFSILLGGCAKSSLEKIPDYTLGIHSDANVQMEFLEKYIAAHPGKDEAYYKLAKLYLENGDADKAYMNITKAYDLNKKEKKYYYLLSKCYYEKHLYQDALEYFLKINPDLVQPNKYVELAADIYFKLNDYKKSLEYLQKTALETPNNPYVYSKMGYIHAFAGDTVQAIQNYNLALSLDSSFVDAYLSMAEIRNAQNEFKEGRQLLRQALKHDTTSSKLYFELANIHKKFDHKDSNIYYLKKTIQYDSSHIPALTQLSNLYYQDKKYEQAERYLVLLNKKLPFDKNIAFKTGVVLALLKKDSLARILLQKIDSSDLNFNFAQYYLKKIDEQTFVRHQSDTITVVKKSVEITKPVKIKRDTTGREKKRVEHKVIEKRDTLKKNVAKPDSVLKNPDPGNDTPKTKTKKKFLKLPFSKKDTTIKN